MATVSSIYKTALWKEIREKVIKRDRAICYFCGKPILKGATVHHLQEVNELNFMNDNIVYNMDNLVCCHRECHNIHHGRFGKQSAVDEDLNIDFRKLRRK